ncbi:hypothetical protein AGMMS50267_11740 [Spirochaetia bacterium]|nr:hypothetical protein AGMMS50267_11740 [Spirochaetia bacterium]
MATVNSMAAFSQWFDPQAPKAYKKWYNRNLARRLTDINNAYKQSFNHDLFTVDTDDLPKEIQNIRRNIVNRWKVPDTTFTEYDKKTANGIPKAIINNYYIPFLNQWDGVSDVPAPVTPSEVDSSDDTDGARITNFTYERDLQYSLRDQAEELFAGYKIFGDNDTGVEYSIGGKRIDLLLENESENKLLAIELKADVADYKVFGQISMYLSLLEEQFPGKEITGIVIAGEIDDTLKIAAKRDKSIKLKSYKMALTLSDET